MARVDEVYVLKELSEIRDELKCRSLALAEKEVAVKEREAAVTYRELVADKREVKLKNRETALKALSLEVEQCVATCYSSINEEIQGGLEVLMCELNSDTLFSFI